MSEELDGPIEIELTSHAPARGRRRAGPATESAAAVPTSRPADIDRPDRPSGAGSESPPGWLGTERSRLVVTAGAVAVVALLIGWMLGRSGGDATSVGDGIATATTVEEPGEPGESDDGQDDDSVFENAEELPDPDDRFDDIIVGDTVTPPVWVRETTTTTLVTTDAVEPEPVAIAIDERVLGLGMEVFAIDAQRRLVGLDLASGGATVRGEQFVVSPDQILAGPAWVAATGYNNQSITIDFDDGVRTSIQVPDPWSLMVDTVQSRFWSRSSARIGTPVYDEYTLDGSPTGRSVALPEFGWPQTVDDGALVTTSVGSVFRIAPDGHEVLGRGELLELSPDVALVRTCDDDLRCGLQVIDRSTGDATWVPEVDDGEETASYYPINSRYGRADGSLSPDGTRLAVARSTAFGEVIGIVDLASGEFTDVTGVSLAENWTWGPSGRFAFFLEGRLPMVNDTETNETFPLSPDALSWTAITGRPIAPVPSN